MQFVLFFCHFKCLISFTKSFPFSPHLNCSFDKFCYQMSNLSTLLQFIWGLFPLVNWLPSNELRKHQCRVALSSKPRLNFYQGFIIRILSALLVFVLIKVNKCLYMSMFQIDPWRIIFQVLQPLLKWLSVSFLYTSTVCLPPETILEENIICHNSNSLFPGNVNYHVDNADIIFH